MKFRYAIIFFIIANICVLSGCNRSEDEKVQQLYKAAYNGNAEAQYVLGRCYISGEGGIEPDVEEAAKWFYKAAEKGHTKAQYIVSCFYENGTGLEKDIEKADYWRRKVIEQGYDVPSVGAHSSVGEKEYNQPEQKKRYNCRLCFDSKECYACKGSGWTAFEPLNEKWDCEECFGTGECSDCAPPKYIDYRCNRCKGSGKCHACTPIASDRTDWIICSVCMRSFSKDNPCSICNGEGVIHAYREAGKNWRP